MVERAIEAQTGAEVDIDEGGDTVSVRGPEGTLTFTGNDEGIELPEDFPATIPVHSDAVPTHYLEVEEAIQVGFRIPAPVAEVRAWYVEQLEDNDWDLQMNMAAPDGGMLSATRDDRALMIVLAVEDGATMAMITLGSE